MLFFHVTKYVESCFEKKPRTAGRLQIIKLWQICCSLQVRHALTLRGYKKGRISQLVSLTRPPSTASGSGAAARPSSANQQSIGEGGGESGKVVDNKEKVLEVLQEVAEDERLNEEERGGPEILQNEVNEGQAVEEPFQDAELPHLYGKQTPRGGWSHVVAPPWVQEILALFPAPGAEEDPAEERDEGPGRKKQRKLWPNETCPGRGPTEPCRFTQRATALGQAAHLGKGEATCKFCDPEKLSACFAVPQQRKFVTRACRVWQAAGREDVVQAAMELMTEEQKALLEKAFARPSRAAAAVEARAVAKAEAEAWEKLLEHRGRSGVQPTEEEQKQYRQKKADDQRRLRSKFGPLVEAKAMEDNSWRSPLATSVEEWRREFAWRKCTSCHRMVTSPLHESNLTGKQGRKGKVVQKCSHCSKGIGYPTVSPADIPEVLHNLTENVLWALRPLEPDVGPVAKARHGYRVHTDMIRFWWRPQTVEEQLGMLEDEEECGLAWEAYQHLVADPESSYGRFVAMHKKFLRRNHAQIQVEERRLQLPRRALEEEGLECAVWPHLYPKTAWCETHIRLQDIRRKESRHGRARSRRRQAPAEAPARARRRSSSSSTSSESDSSSSSSASDKTSAVAARPRADAAQAEAAAEETEAESEDEEEAVAPLHFAREGRNSAKSSYLAKVLGPNLGYGSTYDLFQFVYDLWLWSSLGAKKNTVEAPMRLAMAGYSFSPEYWQSRHAGLVDLVKQLGLPTLFLTIAPYEWSFPFHKWVEDEAAKMLRARLQLPVAETLHIAHVLAQTVVGFLTGANRTAAGKGKKKAWSSHLLAAKDGSGKNTVLNFFGRLEYQDGKRRRYVNEEEAATQFYHGRGTVHLHLLVWLQHVESIELEKVVAATVPADNPVQKSLVEGSQRSWTGSGWPKEPKASYYDADAGVLRLQHTEEDWCKHNRAGVPEGIRAYMPDLLNSLHCHIDVQASDGRGMLLKYVSGYVPKFSDSFTTDWLSDQCSDYAIAKRVLTDYHPLEPEMALQLAMQWFPQCFAGGTLQRFRAPVPWEGTCPERVAQYMRSRWRAEGMCLEEFLRKTNKQGKIHHYIKKAYEKATRHGEQEVLEESLEAWANTVVPQGQVMVAAVYLSRYNDKYYGQRVLMTHPFRKMAELARPELDLVPPHLYYQALAFLVQKEHWTNEAAIRADLELEAFREHHIRNIVAMLFANHSLIEKYIDGTLNKNDDVPEAEWQQEGGDGGNAAQHNPELSRQQTNIVQEIVDRVQQGMHARTCREGAWKGEGPEEETETEKVRAAPAFAGPALASPAFAVLGPAGSGKTTAVHQAIREALELGARVLLTAPTGRLAATMREKFPELEVDTVHGAFLVFKPVQQTLEVMWPYDLVIVEEVGQLSKGIFERIMEQWMAADRLPTLVFVGDFFQLPGVEPTSALDSWMWHNVMLRKRELHTMMRCKCEKLRKTLEILRTGKPSVAQLREIKKGHKAPSLGRGGYIMNEVPSQADVEHILEETPETLVLTVSRQACALLNGFAVEALFGANPPVAMVPSDPESNVQNYEKGKKVRDEPAEIPIHIGMKVILTKNLNKAVGFVNGMGTQVLGMDRGNIIVKTDQGRRLAIHPWTSEEKVVHFPVRLGYASTLHKVQGATLAHITMYLDVPNMPAAAYVALSRVQRDANWRFVGNPGVHHFTLARFH